MPAVLGAFQILLAIGEIGLPTANHGAGPGGVVVVGVGVFAKHPLEIGADRDVLVGQLGIVAALCRRRPG